MLGNVVVVSRHTDVQVAGGSVTKVSHLLVTPRVRREVRAYFGCRGAQGGGSAVVGSSRSGKGTEGRAVGEGVV